MTSITLTELVDLCNEIELDLRFDLEAGMFRSFTGKQPDGELITGKEVSGKLLGRILEMRHKEASPEPS